MRAPPWGPRCSLASKGWLPVPCSAVVKDRELGACSPQPDCPPGQPYPVLGQGHLDAHLYDRGPRDQAGLCRSPRAAAHTWGQSPARGTTSTPRETPQTGVIRAEDAVSMS